MDQKPKWNKEKNQKHRSLTGETKKALSKIAEDP
jgi:hypothetical protein